MAAGLVGSASARVDPQGLGDDPGAELVAAAARAAGSDGARSVRIDVERSERPSGTSVTLSLANGDPWQPCLVLLGHAGETPSLRSGSAFQLPVFLDGQGAARVELGDSRPWAGVSALVVWSGLGGKVRGSTVRQLQPLAGPNPFQRGNVVITEFMKDPSSVNDSQGEWIELHNPNNGRLNLEGMLLSDDGSNSHTFSNNGLGIFVRPGKYIVIGNNNDITTNGGVFVRYRYSGFNLANGADAITITHPSGLVIDRVAYDDGVLWPDQPGMSISLQPGMEHPVWNDDPLNWCQSVTPIGVGNPDTGTPRMPNDICP